MININGHTISTISVSTILGHHGDGMFPLNISSDYRKAKQVIKETGTTILTKSSTTHERQGNYKQWDPRTWGCIRNIPNMGMVNAYGLTNAGVKSCANGIDSAIAKGFNVIPNYSPEFGDDLELTVEETQKSIITLINTLGENFWAIEINISCPNDKTKIKKNTIKAVGLIRRTKIAFPWLTIIAKTSIVHPYEFLQELETAGVDILHLINSIPYDMIFDDESPVSKYGIGGTSGGPAFKPALKYTIGASKATTVHLIAGCGIVNLSNFDMYRDHTRAESFSVCTGLKRNTLWMICLIKMWNRNMRR